VPGARTVVLDKNAGDISLITELLAHV